MKKLLILCLTFTFATELEVDGNLKVTGTVDANGNPITNVGEPILTTDVATANYVNARTAGKGRIITLKCPWVSACSHQSSCEPGINSCDPPVCPEGWIELASFNEVNAMGTSGYLNMLTGNSIRYCMEQETEE